MYRQLVSAFLLFFTAFSVLPNRILAQENDVNARTRFVAAANLGLRRRALHGVTPSSEEGGISIGAMAGGIFGEYGFALALDHSAAGIETTGTRYTAISALALVEHEFIGNRHFGVVLQGAVGPTFEFGRMQQYVDCGFWCDDTRPTSDGYTNLGAELRVTPMLRLGRVLRLGSEVQARLVAPVDGPHLRDYEAELRVAVRVQLEF